MQHGGTRTCSLWPDSSVLREGALVQCAVAYRDVASRGNLLGHMDLDATQGVQIWLAAIQRAAA